MFVCYDASNIIRGNHPMPTASQPGRSGLTLLELVIVLAILVALATIAVPLIGNLVGDSRKDVTRQSLNEIRNVLANMYWDDMGELPRPGALGLGAGRQDHPQVRYLFIGPATEDNSVDYDPTYRRGWRGPYLMDKGAGFPTPDANFTDYYGESNDPAVFDAWGNPIVIQNPGLTPTGNEDVRIVSAGPDGELDINRGTWSTQLEDGSVDYDDDLWVAFELRR
jgi:prepilin-type N-terminal cleavage/methylation domain-containing protein